MCVLHICTFSFYKHAIYSQSLLNKPLSWKEIPQQSPKLPTKCSRVKRAIVMIISTRAKAYFTRLDPHLSHFINDLTEL